MRCRPTLAAPMTPSLAPAARHDAPLRGIGFILVGASVFPVQDVVIKGLSGDYPVLEIVFVRSLVALGLVGVLVVLRPGAAAFDPAALLAVLSALCYAASQTMTRQLGRTHSGATIVLTATLVAAVVAGASGLVAGGGGQGAGLHPSVAF